MLNFIKSNKNKQAYKLDGYDKDWNYVNSGSASFTKLPPGNYTLLVKAAHNDGIWSDTASMHLKMLPPFWRTWWAYCLYALFVIGIFLLVTRYFFLQTSFKKEEELHQVKLIFFTNVSHQILTHLTVIMAPADKLLKNKTQSDYNYQLLSIIKKIRTGY